jgi:hypothetical protein
VQVHPLVIMNVADHCNRVKYIEPKQVRVLGVLLGKQEGRVLDVNNSIEIQPDGQNHINEAFLRRRLEAYKKMFPNLDCVGWYSSGEAHNVDFPLDGDLQL